MASRGDESNGFAVVAVNPSRFGVVDPNRSPLAHRQEWFGAVRHPLGSAVEEHWKEKLQQILHAELSCQYGSCTLLGSCRTPTLIDPCLLGTCRPGMDPRTRNRGICDRGARICSAHVSGYDFRKVARWPCRVLHQVVPGRGRVQLSNGAGSAAHTFAISLGLLS
jgi:hypothetical protein